MFWCTFVFCLSLESCTTYCWWAPSSWWHQDWSCSLWCSLEHLLQHRCDVLQHKLSAHVQFVPKGWQLAQTSLLLRTLSGHTVLEPYCVRVHNTVCEPQPFRLCTSDQCRRYPDSGPFYWKMECAETTPYLSVYHSPSLETGQRGPHPFWKEGERVSGFWSNAQILLPASLASVRERSAVAMVILHLI